MRILATESLPSGHFRDQFVAFRKDCPEGHLERDRFLEIYGAMAPEGADVEHHVDQIFRIFDRDGELQALNTGLG